MKVMVRHVWEWAKERVDARRLTEEAKRLYARRKETVERSFADAKQLHGHRYARMRGLRKVAEQCLLAAAAQNIKKIALLLARLRAPFTSSQARSDCATAHPALLGLRCSSMGRTPRRNRLRLKDKTPCSGKHGVRQQMDGPHRGHCHFRNNGVLLVRVGTAVNGDAART